MNLYHHELGVFAERAARTRWHSRFPVYEAIPEPTEREARIAKALLGLNLTPRGPFPQGMPPRPSEPLPCPPLPPPPPLPQETRETRPPTGETSRR